mgnify:CR=1 FL=1
MPKISTTKNDTLVFNGNCKDTRIRKSQILTGDIKGRLIHSILISKGIYDPDSRNVKRYAKSIKRFRETNKKIKVSRR